MTYGWQEQIRKLQTRIHKENIQKGWWNNEEKPLVADIILNIIGEGLEAWEEYRDNHLLNETYYSIDPEGNKKPEGIPSELADIIIRVLDAAEAWEIDLASIIEEKLKYNKTRPYRHGNKKI